MKFLPVPLFQVAFGTYVNICIQHLQSACSIFVIFCYLALSLYSCGHQRVNKTQQKRWNCDCCHLTAVLARRILFTEKKSFVLIIKIFLDFKCTSIKSHNKLKHWLKHISTRSQTIRSFLKYPANRLGYMYQSRRYLLVQSWQCKPQKNAWNLLVWRPHDLIVKFEQISHNILVFPLVTCNK